MIIYEVNLSIKIGLEISFISWLKCHFEEMFTLKGFTSACLLKDVEPLLKTAN